MPAEGARQPEESRPDEPLPEPEGFDWELTKGVWKNTAGLDKIIEAHSRHWNMKRIGRIELTILRIAAYEITQTDTPPNVIRIRFVISLIADLRFEIDNPANRVRRSISI